MLDCCLEQSHHCWGLWTTCIYFFDRAFSATMQFYHKINKSDSEAASVPVRLNFHIAVQRWINIVDKTVPISTKKIINIIRYSFLSTIILDLFSSKQSLVLAVGIIYNTETWKVRNNISYCIFTNVLGGLRWGSILAIFFRR